MIHILRPRIVCTGTLADVQIADADLLRKIAHPGIHPVAGTAFVCKPPMDGQHHLPGLRLIGERLVLITKPQEFRLAVTLADIHAQFDERLINDVTTLPDELPPM